MAKYGSFERNKIDGKKQIIYDGGGLTSCLSVRLDNVIAYRNKFGEFPLEIDSTKQFQLYADEEGQDVSMYLMGSYGPDNSLPQFNFYHDMQFEWYDKIGLPEITAIANSVCPMSPLVLEKENNMKKIIEDRTAILYRGNDKGMEINRTPYQAMEILAKESGDDKFLVQTDEEEFYWYFKERFPNTICFDEIPRINKNPDSYVMPGKGNKVKFAINFLAALKAISSSPNLITNTGNTGLWAAIFRGKKENIFQWNGKYNEWKKF